jgi:hypothetical protein
LGEFKPDDEGATELVTQDKSHVKIEVDIKNEAVDDPQPTQETLVNKTISITHENKVSNEVTDQPDTSDVHSPNNKPNNTSKETIEEYVMPIIEQPPSSPPPPPPPPPPVKRKVSLSCDYVK